MTPPSPLLTRWLDSVNQPVVWDIEARIDQAINVISDRGGFTRAQCRDILKEIVESMPIKP